MAGLSAFALAFNERSLIPSERFEWDDYRARLFRYALSEAFYNNTAYREVETFALTMKRQYALSKQIRGIYNPVYRQNELIKSKVYGGAMDWEKLERGALAIIGADDALIEALIQILKWSNFGVNKGLYAHQCALLGDVALKVVDDQQRGKVRLEVLHPGKIKEAVFDDVGNVKRVVIEYRREWVDPNTQKSKDVLYTEIIDENRFQYFKDEEPFGWYKDAADNPLPEYDNEYGFVPLVVGEYKDLGRQWGANAFHATIAKIHEVNDVASLLSDGIRKNVDPPWLFSGVNAPTSTPKLPGSLSDGTATMDATAQRDKQKFIYADKEARAQPLVMPIDVPGAIEHINGLLMELERDMPELAMHRLRESGGDKAGIAIRNMYSDATGRLNEAASNLDDALIRGLQMSVSIAGYRGYEAFGGFTLDSYERGDLDFYIKERSFFEDGFSPQERVSNLKSLPDKPEAARAVLEEMEYPADKIDALVAEVALSAQEKQMQQAQPFGSGQNGVSVQPNPRPQLPAGQGQQGAPEAQADVLTPDVLAAIQEIVGEVRVA